ncbi:VOC family protein [Pyruvatibacter sp.]|uniref:VOC family protein n=1 Tax=Pyruvatibacter sp. TaxID=1981328 RepID=UPI0032EAEF60
MIQHIYVNLPVADLGRSRRFFEGVGFSFNEDFSDDTAAGMEIGAQMSAMLLTHEKLAQFAPTPPADAHAVTEVLVALQVDTRAEVDRLVGAARDHGGDEFRPAQDHGFMYGRAFRDPDGHIWEIMWMDPSQMPGD